MPQLRNGDWIEFEPVDVLRPGYNNPIFEEHFLAQVLDSDYPGMSTVRFPDHEGNNGRGNWNIDLNQYRFKIVDPKTFVKPRKLRYKQEREYVFA